MVWQKQISWTEIPTGDRKKMVLMKAMGRSSGSQMARYTLVSGKMIRKTAMEYADCLVDKHIGGNTRRGDARDTVSVGIQTRMNTMDNGKMTRNQVKEQPHLLLLD